MINFNFKAIEAIKKVSSFKYFIKGTLNLIKKGIFLSEKIECV